MRVPEEGGSLCRILEAMARPGAGSAGRRPPRPALTITGGAEPAVRHGSDQGADVTAARHVLLHRRRQTLPGETTERVSDASAATTAAVNARAL